jgi:hypothetical protein
MYTVRVRHGEGGQNTALGRIGALVGHGEGGKNAALDRMSAHLGERINGQVCVFGAKKSSCPSLGCVRRRRLGSYERRSEPCTNPLVALSSRTTAHLLLNSTCCLHIGPLIFPLHARLSRATFVTQRRCSVTPMQPTTTCDTASQSSPTGPARNSLRGPRTG